ncbi:KpsF/GutQ family sugar-phosphate isomerase [Candidatus Pelagibacter sp. FZCC0015]|uniref:KpsF/GutQ family sugar-phosphate isomerase n=1 Tax=Candidatus Pelagibacter sp. FZCC0015 TaxID=2268451 RepID=UPI0011A5DE2D|nr:KpsF/GutQ family sugar-phosphate isomerase [Candidatus Pelagibacter sp. FZCC0015]
MNNKKYIKTARDVINLEIKALQNLKKNINASFNQAVAQIAKCQSKVILCGMGKSGLIASKIAATLASVGTPSFNLSASEASHGDLGMVSKKDILILLSNSGETAELKNIIQFAKRCKILLIGIVSKKDSLLYKAADIKILTPKVIEAGGIVPTSSTTVQLALGDALSIASMQYKKFGKMDFKKLHPAGSLGAQLKTVEDIMVTGKKIPFVSENIQVGKALRILTEKKLGILIIRNKNKKSVGIITDGQIRRISQKKINFQSLQVKEIMTKKPIFIDKNELAAKALNLMNSKKITSLIVNNKKKPQVAIGVVHVHSILQSNIS